MLWTYKQTDKQANRQRRTCYLPRPTDSVGVGNYWTLSKCVSISSSSLFPPILVFCHSISQSPRLALIDDCAWHIMNSWSAELSRITDQRIHLKTRGKIWGHLMHATFTDTQHFNVCNTITSHSRSKLSKFVTTTTFIDVFYLFLSVHSIDKSTCCYSYTIELKYSIWLHLWQSFCQKVKHCQHGYW